MKDSLPTTLPNKLGKTPIEVFWKRNKVMTRLSNLLPRKGNDFRLYCAAKHIAAKITREFLDNPPENHKREHFSIRSMNEKALYCNRLSAGQFYDPADSSTFKLIDYVRKNLMIDMEKNIVAKPLLNADKSLNEEMTFWNLMDSANNYLKSLECTEKVRTQVKSFLLSHYLLPEKDRENFN